MIMKNKQTVLLYILAIVLVVGGLLAVWLPNRGMEATEPTVTTAPRPDTDPDAPFVDLSDGEKEKILQAISAYAEERPTWAPDEVFWYGELKPGQETPLTGDNYQYGVQYYGTFGGYHIVFSPIVSTGMGPMSRKIGGYTFKYVDSFVFYAYKNGAVRLLSDVYEEGLLNDAHIALIHQCYGRYREEIYTRKAWEEHEKN